MSVGMRIIKGYEAVPAQVRGAVLAIGNFDGVHRGHQALIATVLRRARDAGRPAGVIVFEPHPRQFFQPDMPLFRLTPLERKLTLLAGLGLDVAVVLDFAADLARQSADVFIRDVLVEGLGVSHLVVGYDFRFGQKRAGTPTTLTEAGISHGYSVSVVEPVASDGEVFSSSSVRQRISRGDVVGAARLLGHRWRVQGVVVGGAKRGTGLGFPTANVTMPTGTVLGHGIYAARVHVDGHRHDGAAYFGSRPQFDNGKPVLEVFLFDFDGNLYGKSVEIEFIDYVRGDGKFEGIEALKVQMQRDCDAARGMIQAMEAADPLAGSPLAGA